MNELWIVSWIESGYPVVEVFTNEVEAIKCYHHIGNTENVYGLTKESKVAQTNFIE